MARLEEIMAGLFGGNMAPGADELRRRQRGPGGGGYEGIGGAAVTPGQLLPYFQGLRGHDFSGPMGRDFSGRGLQSILAEASGPALSHFAGQGFDFFPPGLDNREAPGGPNVAPGNINNAQAIYQPAANRTPGIPQGVGPGFDPGQVRPRPQTQGWRNLAPGYSAAAQYPEFFDTGGRFTGGAPVPGSPGGPGGRPTTPIGPSGAGPGPRPGGPPQSQNPIAAPAGVGPAAGGGGGGGGTVSGAAGGQGGRPGGGQAAAPAAQPGPQGGRPEGQGGRASVRGGRRGGGGTFDDSTTIADVVGGGFGQVADIAGVAFGGASPRGGRRGGGGSFGRAQNAAGAANIGPGGRPEGRGGRNRDGGRPGNQGMYAGETKAERQARLAAKESRQTERAAREAAQDQRQYEARQAAVASRGAQAAAQEAANPTAPVNPTGQGGRPTAGRTRPARPPRPRLNTGRRS